MKSSLVNYVLGVLILLFFAVTVLVIVAQTAVIQACHDGDQSACDVMRSR